jgi:hypothetical protein
LFRDVAELLRVFFPVREFDTVLLRIFPSMSGFFPDLLHSGGRRVAGTGTDSGSDRPNQ